MHELAITESILNIARKAAEEHHVSRIREIRLKLGEYSGVVPSCVQYYFDVISRGTPAEGACLLMERIPLVMRCRGCGWEGTVDKLHIHCHSCGGTDLEMIHGREFYVESLEVD